MKTNLLIVLLAIFISCNNLATNSNLTNNNVRKNCKTTKQFKDGFLTSDFFETDILEMNKILKNKIFKYPVNEKFEYMYKGDTSNVVYTYSYKRSSIVITKNGKYNYFDEAKIYDDFIYVKKNVRIGMKKQDFLKLINLNTDCDSIKIIDEEPTQFSLFTFKSDTLNCIYHYITL